MSQLSVDTRLIRFCKFNSHEKLSIHRDDACDVKRYIPKLVSNIARDQLYILSHLINPNEKMYIALQL